MANGTSDMLDKSIVAGRKAGDEVIDRKGPAYERWREGMRAAADPSGGPPGSMKTH